MPVEITPTAYAGKRDQASGDEHGELLLMGIPVDDDFSLINALIMNRDQQDPNVSEMRQWYDEFGLPDVLKERFGVSDTPDQEI